jgi:hypothetical protein
MRISRATTVLGASRARKAQDVLQGAGEARSRPGPGHLFGDHPAGRVVDPAHLAAQLAAGPEGVEVPPAAQRAVVDRASGVAAAGAAHPPALGPCDVHDHPLLVALDELDRHHPLAAQPEQALE